MVNESTKKQQDVPAWTPLNISLLLLSTLLLLLLTLQQQVNSLGFLKLFTELYGAFVVTFLGVYVSISYSKKLELKREEKDRKKFTLVP